MPDAPQDWTASLACPLHKPSSTHPNEVAEPTRNIPNVVFALIGAAFLAWIGVVLIVHGGWALLGLLLVAFFLFGCVYGFFEAYPKVTRDIKGNPIP